MPDETDTLKRIGPIKEAEASFKLQLKKAISAYVSSSMEKGDKNPQHAKDVRNAVNNLESFIDELENEIEQLKDLCMYANKILDIEVCP